MGDLSGALPCKSGCFFMVKQKAGNARLSMKVSKRRLAAALQNYCGVLPLFFIPDVFAFAALFAFVFAALAGTTFS